MSWATAYQKFHHTMFIAYIELKIEGLWHRAREEFAQGSIVFEALTANSSNCMVHLIEPDGLRKIISVMENGTIALHQNILSYNPEEVTPMTIDEKEQSGKGKTRDVLE